MSRIRELRRLHDFMVWADRALYENLCRRPDLREAWLEYTHVLGAEETWLARLEGREPMAPVWPDLPPDEVDTLRERLASAFSAYLGGLDEAWLDRPVRYTNSAGASFETSVGDILLHVALHGQYHRGKVNLLLRQAGVEPAPVDFVGWIRGAPAAVTPPRS
ncbi:MAG: DinB family protein [Gemmatimonadota bacterium]|nr:DinB family protein [Gemmatimonadota bacterium]